MKKFKKYRLLLIYLALSIIFFALHLIDVRSAVINSGDIFLYRNYFLIYMAAMLIFVLLYKFLYIKTDKIAYDKIFVIGLFCIGSLYMFIMPALSAPDEIRHYISSYELSSRILQKESKTDEGEVLIRAVDLYIEDAKGSYILEQKSIKTANDKIVKVLKRTDNDAFGKVLGSPLEEWTYKEIESNYKNNKYKVYDKDTLAVSAYKPVEISFVAYLIPALGMSIARILNLNSIKLLFLARVFNLTFFCLLLYFSIRKMTAKFKEIFIAVSLLPMSLHLVSSLSYDTLILALAFYFTACIFSLAYEKKTVSLFDFILPTCIMVLLAPCKMVYSPLIFLFFLIPGKKFNKRNEYMVSFIILFLATASSVYLSNKMIVQRYALESGNYVAWAGEEGYTLTYIISNFKEFIKIIYNTFVWKAGEYHQSMIGMYLGNFDEAVDVPYAAVMIFSLVLIFAGLRKDGESELLSVRGIYVISATSIICIGGIVLSMLLAYTPIGSRTVLGVQGRYFLPVLPLVLALLKKIDFIRSKDRSREALTVLYFTNIYILIRLFARICVRM